MSLLFWPKQVLQPVPPVAPALATTTDLAAGDTATLASANTTASAALTAATDPLKFTTTVGLMLYNRPTGQTVAWADGSRWQWSATGTADGGAVVAAFNGGYWIRDAVDVLYLRWYGIKGDGVTDNSPILNNLLRFLETQGKYAVKLVFDSAPLPYLFKTALEPICRHYLTFEGAGQDLTIIEGQFAGSLFTIGRFAGVNLLSQPVAAFRTAGTTFRNMTVRHPALNDPLLYRGNPAAPGYTFDSARVAASGGTYLQASADPANLAQWLLFDFKYGDIITLENVKIGGAYAFARFGDPAGYCSTVVFRNVTGFTYNRGQPAVKVVNGAGFRWDGGSFFANVGFPQYQYITVASVNRRYMEYMLTRAGTSMFSIEGAWDTFLVSNCLFERFSEGYAFKGAAGQTFSYCRNNNVIFDYIRFNCLDFQSNLGAVSDFDAGNMYMTAVEGYNVFMPNTTGFIVEFKCNNAKMYIAGNQNIYISHTQLRSVSFTGGDIYAGQMGFNKTDYAIGGYTDGYLLSTAHDTKSAGAFAVYLGASVQGVAFRNVRINEWAGGSTPYGAGYGMYIHPTAYDYDISGCKIDGALLGLQADDPASGTPGPRSIRGNRVSNWYASGYATRTVTIPASNTAWSNNTAYQLTVNFAGGTVTDIKRNGASTGRTSGEFIVQPGETLTPVYSVAPTMTATATP